MTDPGSTKPVNRHIGAIVFGSMLLTVALAAGIAGSQSSELLQQVAARIRNAEDFTPARFHRYLQTCWFFAVSLGLCGLWCFRFRDRPGHSESALWTDIATLNPGVRRFLCHISRLGWFAILTGVGVRLWFLDLPMAYDESYSFVNFASRPIYLAIADYNSTNNHLFNTFLMHWMFRLFGQQDWALRLPAFCFGVMLLPTVWHWAKDRFSEWVANTATALVAISPAVVSYSVNARGYIYLTFCAVLLDWSLYRLSSQKEKSLLSWCMAWIATVIGCWSMPLMVYPALGLFGWFVLEPVIVLRSREQFTLRLRSLIPFGVAAMISVTAFYAPSFVFRGLLFLDDPIVGKWDSLPGSQVCRRCCWTRHSGGWLFRR